MRYLLAFLALLLIFLSACEIRTPVFPSWDVTLRIPLLNEKFFVSDLVDSVNIVVGDNEILTLTGTGSAHTPAFGAVSFNPQINEGPLPLVAGTPVNTTFSLVDPTGNIELSYGRFSAGEISARFQNVVAGVSQIKLTFPQLHTPSGETFEIMYEGNSGWHDYPLEGSSLGTLDSGQLLTQLNLTITTVSNQPNGTPLGDVSLMVNNTLGFDIFQGRLQNYNLPLEDTETAISIDYPYDIEEAIQLQEATLFVNLSNQVGFAAEFHGNFYAKNTRTNEERSIPIVDNNGDYYIAPAATAAGPGVTPLVFDNNIAQLLQIMPDIVEIRDAQFYIHSGAAGPIGTVNSTDQISCDYQIDAPFSFILFDHTIRMTDPVQINITEENRNRIQKNALGADLTLSLVNMIPVGATASIYVATNDTIDTADPATYEFVKSVTVHSSEYVGPDVNELGEQTIQLSLNKTELDVFTNPSVYMLWTFSFEASNGVVSVSASPASYIHVRSMIAAQIHIEEE
jgi:hypothetical protein